MARRVLMAGLSEVWVRGRPWLGWMDGVKVAFGQQRYNCRGKRDKKEWSALVNMWLIELHTAIFALFLFSHLSPR